MNFDSDCGLIPVLGQADGILSLSLKGGAPSSKLQVIKAFRNSHSTQINFAAPIFGGFP